jgi:zinc-binding alcohol dehydrogenase/oxidoreductase
MKALVLHSEKEKLMIREMPAPVPGKDEVVIALKYAALNHLDIWIWKEQSPAEPVILGSDGSGVVHAIGDGVDRGLIGREVVINPALYWGPAQNVQSEDFQILGSPTNGTFAEFIVIRREYVYEKPKHLSLKEAAALPLAGLTAYRALFTKAGIKQVADHRHWRWRRFISIANGSRSRKFSFCHFVF